MKTIEIKTQEELDALPDFSEYTLIKITGGTEFNKIIVRKAWDSSHVVAWDSSHVEACGSSHVEARGSSHVVAWDSSHVEACGSSHVVARESSHVVARESSHVVARESSHVEARGSSHVEAWDSSHVEAWDSSHVEACGSSHVVARGSSHVVAWDSSHVEARESSHVVARESSHVEAWDSSHVVAWDSVSIHVQSEFSSVELFAFAICILLQKCKVTKKSKTCIVVQPKQEKGNSGWLNSHGIKSSKGAVILFKRVSSKFLTQEETPNETDWTPGMKQTHKKWNPAKEECGEGKFHACATPYFCDEFRSEIGGKYVAIKIAVKDLHAWDGTRYPHKIAFRAGTVLHECDRYGKKI